MYYLIQKAQNGRISSDLAVFVPNWPIKAIPCSQEDTIDEGWEMLTQAQLDTLKEENYEAYKRWEAKNKKESAKQEAKEKAEKERPCRAAQERLALLGFEQEEIKMIMGGRYCE